MLVKPLGNETVLLLRCHYITAVVQFVGVFSGLRRSNSFTILAIASNYVQGNSHLLLFILRNDE